MENIIITYPEYMCIESVENEDYKKILYLMLASAKNFNSNICREDIFTLSKIAELHWGVAQRNNALKNLYELGFIDISEYGLLKVNYIIDGIVSFNVDNWAETYLEYLKFIGNKKVEKCSCGNLYFKNSNNHVFCKRCSYEREKIRAKLAAAVIYKRKKNES